MAELKPCPRCNGEAKLYRVGDWKQYCVFYCSVCGYQPVNIHEANTTVRGAKRAWNRRADNG